jgi:hypothetical protein
MEIPKLIKSPFVIILATAIISYWPIAFFDYTFKWDMLDVVFPFRYFAGECIQNGIFPLWNPYQLTGSPIHADLQYPLWSPEVWLVGLTTGYNIYILHILFIFYIFLAGYGMYRLTLFIARHRLASVITGVSFMLSGFFVGHGQALFSIIGASFLPWVVLYMIKNLSKPSLYRTLKLALFIFLQLSTGYQTISIITGYLLLIIFLYYLFENIKNRNRFFSILKLNGLLILVLLLLCIVIFIPVLQVAGFNDRISAGLSYEKATVYPFTFNCLISLFTPFATVKYPEFFNTDISMRNMHFGLLMLLVFIVALFKRKTGLQWVMLVFGFICFLASLGDALPVYKFLYQHVPLINRLRMPAYFNLFTVFTILFSAGVSLPNLLNQIKRYRKSLLYVLSSALCVLLVMLIISVFRINFGTSVLRNILQQPFLIPSGLTFYEHLAIQSVLQGFLLTLILIVLVKKSFSGYFITVFPALVVVEMIVAVNLNSYYTVISTIKPYELNEYLSGQPKGFPIPDNKSIIENSDKKLTHAPFWRNMGTLTKRISFDGFTSFVLKPYDYLYDSLPRLKDTLLNNPPVYLSGRVYKISSLKSPRISFSRNDLFVSDSVFLTLPSTLKKDLVRNMIDILSFNPVKITIRYEIDTTAIITLMQADYPGWGVRIDGEEVSHFTSNNLYISAIAPPGKHTVVFEYKNRIVVVSFIVSYSVLTALIILLFYLSFRSLSPWKVKFFTVLVIISVLLLIIAFFTNKSIDQKKEDTYKIFSDTLAVWEKELAPDSFHGVFNIDDTIKFNQLTGNKKTKKINYFRFNETRDLGELYRYLTAVNDDHIVYGYSNLFNPPEAEAMIREKYPRRGKPVVTALGKMALYSRSDSDKPVNVVFNSINDYESPYFCWSDNSTKFDSSFALTGKYCERMDSAKQYSSTFREKINNITRKKNLYLVITADVYLSVNSNPLLVFEEKNGDRSIRWMSLDVKQFAKYANQWGKVYYMVKLNKGGSSRDAISVYFWNIDRGTFYIDNFKIEGINVE